MVSVGTRHLSASLQVEELTPRSYAKHVARIAVDILVGDILVVLRRVGSHLELEQVARTIDGAVAHQQIAST